ncbi:MAG: hypothetical protein ABIP21_10855, partial [Acidimicrobiia bacterium]
MKVRSRRVGALAVAVAAIVVLASCKPVRPGGPPAAGPPDRARYILPAGNYGGFPTTVNSTDQLPLYDALTPLRGNVTDADLEKNFLPEDFKPVGATRVEPTGRPGTTVTYDSYGVAHV